jgi:hypothetical protein
MVAAIQARSPPHFRSQGLGRTRTDRRIFPRVPLLVAAHAQIADAYRAGAGRCPLFRCAGEPQACPALQPVIVYLSRRASRLPN